MASLTKKKLIEVQMSIWPASVVLTIDEVINWARVGMAAGDMTRPNLVLMTLRHPLGIWYRIPHAHGEWRGFRYGYKPEHYLSF